MVSDKRNMHFALIVSALVGNSSRITPFPHPRHYTHSLCPVPVHARLHCTSYALLLEKQQYSGPQVVCYFMHTHVIFYGNTTSSRTLNTLPTGVKGNDS